MAHSRDREGSNSNLWQMPGKIYDFVRAYETSPNVITTTDGTAFTYAGRLTSTPTEGYAAGYYKYWGNNVDRIDFVGTEAHPRDNDNSLYHGYVQLVELQRDQLVTEGAIGQSGVTLRTLATGGSLLAIGANRVTFIEVANRASPVARGKVILSESPEARTRNSFPTVTRVSRGNDGFREEGYYACTMSRTANARGAFWGSVLAILLVARMRRKQAH